MPLTVTLVNHARNGMEVHKPGCAHIPRAKKLLLVNSDWDIEVPDGVSPLRAAVDDLNDSFGWEPGSDEPAPWSEHDIRVLPCVGKGRK